MLQCVLAQHTFNFQLKPTKPLGSSDAKHVFLQGNSHVQPLSARHARLSASFYAAQWQEMEPQAEGEGAQGDLIKISSSGCGSPFSKVIAQGMNLDSADLLATVNDKAKKTLPNWKCPCVVVLHVAGQEKEVFIDAAWLRTSKATGVRS